MPFPEYTPVPTRLVTLAEADDGEQLAAATTNVSLEQLADGILWVDSNSVRVPAIVDQWTALRTPVINEVSKSSSSFNITIPPTDQGSQLIDLPSGVTIDALRVYIDPSAHVSLPTINKFIMSIIRRERSTNVETTVLSNTEDPSGSTGVYDAYHVIEATFSDHTIDNALYTYYVRVFGEDGMNTQNVAWHGSSVRVSMSAASYF